MKPLSVLRSDWPPSNSVLGFTATGRPLTYSSYPELLSFPHAETVKVLLDFESVRDKAT